MKDSVWLSFMKDRYGHIDPKRLADVDESDLRKALAWKYKGDVLDQKINTIGVFRDSMKPPEGRKEWYYLIRRIPFNQDSVDRFLPIDVRNWRDTIVARPSGWTEPAKERPRKKARTDEPDDDDCDADGERKSFVQA